ncbi:hypothetical protein ABT297_34205 [Dactylosporangium sp. NPDC000555]|uniref:hypothetical protein n=1 Tax=Dactylosporangium sp. NPDC000555 TaxID=3154260 RepID=UPI003332E8C2
MSDPFSAAIIWALHHYGVILISVLVIVLTMEALTEWFRQRGHIKAADEKIIAFTIAERVANQQYAVIPGVFDGKPRNTRIVQGFYNQATKQVIDARAIASSRSPSREIIESHAAGAGMVVYR